MRNPSKSYTTCPSSIHPRRWGSSRSRVRVCVRGSHPEYGVVEFRCGVVVVVDGGGGGAVVGMELGNAIDSSR